MEQVFYCIGNRIKLGIVFKLTIFIKYAILKAIALSTCLLLQAFVKGGRIPSVAKSVVSCRLMRLRS
jgi:hypothetical protein